MPDIPLPTFDGQIKKWPRFWAKFSSLINFNTDLSQAMKQHYLISRLSDNAKKTVQHMELVGNCYDQITIILK
jgi:Protein of unknown function (DUF1759)